MYISLTDDEAQLLKRMLATPTNYAKPALPASMEPDPAVSLGVSIINKIQNEIDPPALDAHYMDLAMEHPMVSDGCLEIDECPLVSVGDDDGAYVMAWLWVESNGEEPGADDDED